MRCKTCDYRLWNLTSRQCPECGTPFLPTDYDFVPNSVRFCCPHCSQEYYGTAPNGHLVPTAFDCVRCGEPVQMDEMILLPAEGVEEEQTQISPLIWLERSKRGFWRSWVSTIGMALVRPGKVMDQTPLEGTVAPAFWFALLTNFAIGCVGLLPVLLVTGVLGGGTRPGVVLAPMAIVPCFAMASVLVGIVLWGLLTHAVLAITGGGRGGIGRTYQALCFSSGANVISAIPCLGPYLGPIWWWVSAVIMVKVGQRVGGLRAALAVSLLPAGFIVGFVFLILAGVRSATTAANQFGTLNTSSVLDAVLRSAEAHNYQGPDHALALVTEGLLEVDEFTAKDSATLAQDVPVGAGTLEDLGNAAAVEQVRLAKEAAAALPDGVIAHRVGDYVFTYHGATLNTCPPNLWVVIESYDPDISHPTTGVAPLVAFTVGNADGTTTVITAQSLRQALAAQNRLRATINLPPLPDPSTVTHAQPAVGVPLAAEADEP